MSRALESFTGLLGKCSVLVPHSPDAHQLQPPTPVLFFAGDPVCLLGFRPAGETQLQPADGHAGEAAQAQPTALPPWALLEVG